MGMTPDCAGGRTHRWDCLMLGWFNGTPIQVCDCGLLRVGVATQGDSYDWTYYRIVPCAKYGEYDLARHARAYS